MQEKKTHNEHIAELRLKGELIKIKNMRYEDLDKIIWDNKKQFKSWAECHAAIDAMLIQMQQDIVDAINESGLADDKIK